MRNTVFVIFLILYSCSLFSCSNEDENPTSNSKGLKFSKADFKEAQYLAITSLNNGSPFNKNTRGIGVDTKELFQIDKDGNMIPVTFSFKNTESGEIRNDIKVLPEKIIDLGGELTVFKYCSFYGDDIESIIGNYGESPCFIIQNSTGKVYFVPKEGEELIPNYYSPYTFAKNDDGTYYLGNICQLSLNGENAYLRQISPDGLHMGNFVVTNQPNVLVTGSWENGMNDHTHYSSTPPNILYPNGGFEKIKLAKEKPIGEGYQEENLFHVGKDIKILRQTYNLQDGEGYYQILSIHNLSIGTQPPYSVSEAEKSLYRKIYFHSYFSAVIDCEEHYAILSNDTCLVINKNDNEIKEITDDFILPDNSYGYNNRIKNKIYQVDTRNESISCFDYETLTYSEVQYDIKQFDVFITTNEKLYVDKGQYIINGVRNSDGLPIRIEIDINTGNAEYFVNPDNRKIIELIQVN